MKLNRNRGKNNIIIAIKRSNGSYSYWDKRGDGIVDDIRLAHHYTITQAKRHVADLSYMKLIIVNDGPMIHTYTDYET
jgi:hypothetical protein